MSMLARENKACAANKPDKVALAEVHAVIKKHYQVRGDVLCASSRGCLARSARAVVL